MIMQVKYLKYVVLLEKLIVAQLVKKCPSAFMEPKSSITMFTEVQHPNLSQFIPAHNTTPCFFDTL